MPKTKATAVPITERDVRGYHYVGGKMKRNGGVTAIAAINGRGAYAANLKAREVTAGKKPGLARKAARSVVNRLTEEPLVLRIHPVYRMAKRTQGKMRDKVLNSLGSKPMLNQNPRGRKAPTAAQMRARKEFSRKAKLGLFRKNPRRHPTVLMPSAIKSVGRSGTMRMPARRTLPMSATARERVRHASGMKRNPMRFVPAADRRSGSLPRFMLPGEKGGKVIRTKKIRHTAVPAATRSLSGRSLSSARTRKMASAGKRKTRKAPSAKSAARAQESTMAKSRKKRSVKARAAAKVRTAKRTVHRKKAASKRKATKRTRQTAAQKKASLRNLRKARAAKKVGTKRVRRSRKHTTKRKATKRTRQTAAQKKASLRNLRKARDAKKATGGRSARKIHRKGKKHASKRTHRSAAQKAASKRNIKKAHASTRRGGKKMRKNGRRHHAMKHGIMRRNDGLGAFATAINVGAIAMLGFGTHKFVTALVNRLVIDKVVNKSVQAVAENPATAPAAAGLGAAQPIIGGLLGGGLVLAAGVLAVNKFVESQDTKRILTAGMVTSFLQTLIVTALESVAPQAAPMLSGGEASRLSAMYGIDPTSIGPRYARINGVGEYFQTNGLGEYFQTNGLGEYFQTNGLGNYTGNPDLMQAAAGYGEMEASTNHIDPSSDLERELTLAEAAAGVGSVQQAAAGMGNLYQAAAGFGAINTVPRVDTVIPSGQLWAGTHSVDGGENAETPAGILSTGGGEGIFG